MLTWTGGKTLEADAVRAAWLHRESEWERARGWWLILAVCAFAVGLVLGMIAGSEVQRGIVRAELCDRAGLVRGMECANR